MVFFHKKIFFVYLTNYFLEISQIDQLIYTNSSRE